MSERTEGTQHYMDSGEYEGEYEKPDPAPNCPTRIMDGRNELRCWFLEGHEGECK